MDILFTIAAFLLLVGIVVTIHEGGHFFTALLCNIRILEFSIGFGPKIIQKKVGKSQILFTLRMLPLGGFVKPLDENSVTKEDWEKLSYEEKQQSFSNSKKWKKILMVAGGPFSNFILALFIFSIAFIFIGNTGFAPIIGEVLPNSVAAKSGLKENDKIIDINGKKINFMNDAHAIIANSTINNEILTITTDNNSVHKLDFSSVDLKNLGDDLAKITGIYFQSPLNDIVVKNILPDSSAFKAGLVSGDKIIKIGDFETRDLSKLMRFIKANPNKTFDILYLHNFEEKKSTITLSSNVTNGITVGKIGVEFETPKFTQEPFKYNFYDGVSESFDRVYNSTLTTLVSLKKIATGEISTKAISGPLSIADFSGRSAKKGLYTYLMMMAAISIAVGVFNLLPIPMLDGGHLAQYSIEYIIRKDFTISQLQKMQYVGIAAMTGIFTLAITNDLVKYIGFLT